MGITFDLIFRFPKIYFKLLRLEISQGFFAIQLLTWFYFGETTTGLFSFFWFKGDNMPSVMLFGKRFGKVYSLKEKEKQNVKNQRG